MPDPLIGHADLHPVGRGAPARDDQRAAARHRLDGVAHEIGARLGDEPRVRRDAGQTPPGSRTISTPALAASGRATRATSDRTALTSTGARRRSCGRTNRRKPCTTRSSRWISCAMTSMFSAISGGAGAPVWREPRAQELEMDAHRVERVLDLVGHAGCEAAQRRQLLGVAQQGLDRPGRLEIAQDEQAARGLGIRAERISRNRPLVRLPRASREGDRVVERRDASVENGGGQPSRAGGRGEDIGERAAGQRPAEQPFGGRVGERHGAVGAEEQDGVLEPLGARPGPGHPRRPRWPGCARRGPASARRDAPCRRRVRTRAAASPRARRSTRRAIRRR